jgi:predicted glutamine amidotransferase
MCRLLAYSSSRAARSLAETLGPADFADFVALSRLHRDGWGMSWVMDTEDVSEAAVQPAEGIGDLLRAGPLFVARSTLPAFEDERFARLARRPLGSAGFVHLRWATSGLAVDEANTHPFLLDGWSFAHQGSIPTPERVAAMLRPEWSARLGGSTDSERYFLYFLQCLDEEGEVVAALRRAVIEVTEACGPASLNALLLSSEALVVVHGRTDLDSSVEDMLEVVGTRDRIPSDHIDKYFDLRCRQDSEGVVAVSTGLRSGGWEVLAPNSALFVDLSRRLASVHPLAC